MGSDEARRPEGPPGRVRRWLGSAALWRLPPGAVALLVVVEGAALAAAVWAAVAVPVTARDAVVLGLLLALEFGYVEVMRWARPRPDRRGRPRRGNLSSVVVFAGAVLLPPVAVVVLPVIGHVYEPRRLGMPVGAPYRVVYTIATTVLACLAVWQVRLWWAGGAPIAGAGLPLVLVSVVVFAMVEGVLVAAAVASTEQDPPVRRLIGGFDDNLLEVATLALGGLAAAAITATPWLVPLVLPAMVVMHRAMLVPQLTEDGHVDGKTGLLNAAAWHERAAADLAAARPGDAPRAVLVIDLDHFKVVNDTYGHVAGDVVLAAVAGAVRGAVRSRDLVGRFGGEEFVVLVAPEEGAAAGPADGQAAGHGGARDVEQIAHRIRRTVAALRVPVDTAEGSTVVGGLRVSVGAGVQRSGGDPARRGDLGDLVRVADEALYAAKRAGRDQVRVTALTPYS